MLEHRPVAALEIDGRRVRSGGGVVLNGVHAADDLPSIQHGSTPADGRVSDRRTRDALAIAAAAPRRSSTRSERLTWGDGGLTLDLGTVRR